MMISRRAWLRGFGVACGLGLAAGGWGWRRFGTAEHADLSGWAGFTGDDIALLDEIAESIIPETDTPGARAAGVGTFMATAVTDCYDLPWQSAFVYGLRAIETMATRRYGRGFRLLSSPERVAVLSEIQGEQKWRELWNRGERGLRIVGRPLFGPLPRPVQTPHYFTMMKELTILGYFTSQMGATEALRHQAIPGSYDGALPYKKGDRAWSL